MSHAGIKMQGPDAWAARGGHRSINDALPFYYGLASRADRLFLPLLLQAERPIEQGWDCRLGIADWGLRPRPLGFTISSAMNSAQENSDCCLSAQAGGSGSSS